MPAAHPPLGLWTEEEAVVWADRQLPPSYLRGVALRTWLLARSTPAVAPSLDDVVAAGIGDAETAERVLAGLRLLGLLDEAAPVPEAAPADDEAVVALAVPVTAPVGTWPDA